MACRQTGSGRLTGGGRFNRGALFYLLRNRTYLGMIVHRTKVYPGMHPAIVEPELFQAVQSRLEANRQQRAVRRDRVARAPLTGRIFDVDGQPMSVKMGGNISVNDIEAYVACALQGFGMIQPARFMVLPHLESGALVEVLPQLSPSPMPISVAYMQNRHLSPKVRAFVDWVAELFGGCPLLGGIDNGNGECSFTARSGDNTMRSEAVLQNVAEQAAIQE